MAEVSRRSVSRYDLVRVLGRGGMAVVYLARQRDLDRLVALKELAVFRSEDAEFVRRFVRESRVSGSLSHENIVTVHEYFVADEVPYIAMEFVEGRSLRRYMDLLNLAQIAGTLEGILAALGYAGARGIVHRDIKPENVMVSLTGRVKVADFGIAKATDLLLSDQSVLTQDGMAVGTPAYMAPEQALSADVGPAADLYSTGVIAYELILGQRPFPEPITPAAALLRLVNQDVPAPLEVHPDLDAGLADWLERMLARDPTDRFDDAAEAWHELEEHIIRLLGPRWRRESRLDVDRDDTPRDDGRSLPAIDPQPDRQGASGGAPVTLSDSDGDRVREPAPSTALLAALDRAVETRPDTPPPGPWTPAPGQDAVALDESWPVHDEEDDVVRESVRTRRGRTKVLAMAAGMATAVGMAAILALGGGSDAGGGDAAGAPDGPLTSTASTASLQIGLPAAWRRLDPVPEVAGLRLADAVAVSRSDRSVRVVAGMSRADGLALLPSRFLGSVDGRSGSGREVSLGRLEALEYEGVTRQGITGTLAIAAVPTDAGVATVVCAHPAGEPPPACRRIARSLVLLGPNPVPVGPSLAYGRRVVATLATLKAARDRGDRSLDSARTQVGQARASSRLSSGYRRARRALASLQLKPVDRRLNSGLSRALADVAVGYRDLGRAVKADSPSRFRSARTRIRAGAGLLVAARERVEAAGYDDLPAIDARPDIPAQRRAKKKVRSTKSGTPGVDRTAPGSSSGGTPTTPDEPRPTRTQGGGNTKTPTGPAPSGPKPATPDPGDVDIGLG